MMNTLSRLAGIAAVVLTIKAIFDGAMQDWFGEPFSMAPAIQLLCAVALCLVSILTAPQPHQPGDDGND